MFIQILNLLLHAYRCEGVEKEQVAALYVLDDSTNEHCFTLMSPKQHHAARSWDIASRVERSLQQQNSIFRVFTERVVLINGEKTETQYVINVRVAEQLSQQDLPSGGSFVQAVAA